jgi:CelD/BcsL family acetyltransferase involved in cellulose biosynthesis
VRLTWIRELAERGNLREQWNALALQMERPEVFYTWEWSAAVTRAYRTSPEPWIATAYEGEELVGVAALAKSSATQAVFLAGATADYCDFISRPERRREFVAELLGSLEEHGIRNLVLANLPENSATAAALRENGVFRSFLRAGYVCAQVQLGSEQQRLSLRQSVLKKEMLRRKLSLLERFGPVMLRHDRGEVLRKDSLGSFFSAHVARFLATGRLSNLVMRERREFLIALAQLLAEQGWFDLTTLYAGDQVMAYNFGLRFQASWFWYQPTIVNEFDGFSPGYCLLAKMVVEATEDPGTRVVDLGLGAEGYKEKFANAERRTLHATLSRGALDDWRARGRYQAAEGIKMRTRLEPLARRVQRAIGRGRQRVQESGWLRTLTWAGSRLRRSLASQDEVRLFRWQSHGVDSQTGAAVVHLDWEILARAAMRYAEDRETLDYLLRSANRYRSRMQAGYALLGENGAAQHFAWVAPYEGFAMAELGEKLRAPSPASVMIFDCWTPREWRGRGLYGRAIQQLAARLSAEGKEVWIFSAAANPASLAGIEKAGFQRQFSLVRRKILSWARIRQEPCELPEARPLSKDAVR